MPTARKLIAGLALALTAVSCTDKGPTAPTDQGKTATAPAFKPTSRGLVTTIENLVVTDPVSGQTAVFNGTATITSFTTNAAGDLIVQAGTLTVRSWARLPIMK